MMRFCLMDPRSFNWDRLLWMNRQWKGIVFLSFQNENAPKFILNLVEELQNKKITESIAPCRLFAKSFMMISPATGRKDLVLLLRELDEKAFSLLEQWRSTQKNDTDEQIVLALTDYIAEYAAEFTGINLSVQTAQKGASNEKTRNTADKQSEKLKKNRRRANSPESNTSAETPAHQEPGNSVEVGSDAADANKASAKENMDSDSIKQP